MKTMTITGYMKPGLDIRQNSQCTSIDVWLHRSCCDINGEIPVVVTIEQKKKGKA